MRSTSQKRQSPRCRRIITLVFLLGSPVPSLLAQTPAGQPATIKGVVVSGSLRSRAYWWNWFGDDASGEYTYPGLLARLGFSQSRKTFDWQLEVALPAVLGLPSDAVAASPQGQLGLGATYFAANSNRSNAAAIFIKQGSIRFKDLGGVAGQSLRVGRMEFNDGTEVTPRNTTLAAVKRDRIAQRLIGTFGFSDVGRSIDGAQYGLAGRKLNFTFLGGRPTQGVFQVDGWGELRVNVFYGTLTGQLGGEHNAAEWRVLGLGYSDYRHNVLKTDNRPLAARQADRESINVATYGGHYLRVDQTSVGPFDLLFWGVLQVGSWGTLAQRAGALAAEAGWQPERPAKIRPWIRGGYNYGSGDSDPTDRKHGTFFQVLPTPRIYARFPFFNMMNARDLFAELVLRPSRNVTLRTDVHRLGLADRNDLWYLGGGAFQPSTFGYTGRPANARSSLATLYDLSADYGLNAHTSVAAYVSLASGKQITQAIYPNGPDASFGYVEMIVRF